MALTSPKNDGRSRRDYGAALNEESDVANRDGWWYEIALYYLTSPD